jgi:hypothetical protein
MMRNIARYRMHQVKRSPKTKMTPKAKQILIVIRMATTQSLTKMRLRMFKTSATISAVALSAKMGWAAPPLWSSASFLSTTVLSPFLLLSVFALLSASFSFLDFFSSSTPQRWCRPAHLSAQSDSRDRRRRLKHEREGDRLGGYRGRYRCPTSVSSP